MIATLARRRGDLVDHPASSQITRGRAPRRAPVSRADPKDVEAIATTAKPLGTVDFVMNIIPTSVVDAFAKGEILQVLLFSVLFGLALLSLGDKGAELVKLIDQLSHALFGVIAILMKFAPIDERTKKEDLSIKGG